MGGRRHPDRSTAPSTTTRPSRRSRTTRSATSAAPMPSTTTPPAPSPATPAPAPLDINIPFTNAGTTTVSTGDAADSTEAARARGRSTRALRIDADLQQQLLDVTAGTFTVPATLNLQGGTIDMTPTTYTVSTVNLAGIHVQPEQDLQREQLEPLWRDPGRLGQRDGGLRGRPTPGPAARRPEAAHDHRGGRDPDDQLGRGRGPASDHQQRDDHVGGRRAPDESTARSTTTRRLRPSRTTTSATSAGPTPSTTTQPERSPATPGPGSWT